MCFFCFDFRSEMFLSTLELVGHSTEVVLELFDLVEELVLLSVPKRGIVKVEREGDWYQ